MNLTTSLVAGTAVLATGGLFAGQAMAAPVTPLPSPTVTTSATSATARQLGQAGVIWFYTAISSAQRDCLADANLQRPEGKLTAEQRRQLNSQVKSALSDCKITVRGKAAERQRLGFAWAGLTSEQQHCLADTVLTRPVGKLTAEQRAAVRQSKLDAANACGVGV
ncbi:hypothetical protein ATK74_2303 [Propionicimonas paludicola]|uniref:Uncharacterized protein n=1 Tax=Propionicimonas paludicola TaxID=185243 RepID=A0A2A9CVS0_9ACTN|nr:hypothetical protein [Propionicimonas paludicola]PFG17730.1 hypothetical protein ATK74_2303 [Propionicimonas paludicola]